MPGPASFNHTLQNRECCCGCQLWLTCNAQKPASWAPASFIPHRPNLPVDHVLTASTPTWSFDPSHLALSVHYLTNKLRGSCAVHRGSCVQDLWHWIALWVGCSVGKQERQQTATVKQSVKSGSLAGKHCPDCWQWLAESIERDWVLASLFKSFWQAPTDLVQMIWFLDLICTQSFSVVCVLSRRALPPLGKCICFSFWGNTHLETFEASCADWGCLML